VGDSISHKDLHNLNLKVSNRLKHKYRTPESFSNNHISNLVEVFNTYDNYIKTFESIEISDNSNCLDRNKYLINHDLHNVLINGYRLGRDRISNCTVMFWSHYRGESEFHFWGAFTPL
jgi:hypothetical protein